MKRPSTILTELVELLQRSPSDADLDRAQWHLLDWVGCATLGVQSPVAEKIARTLSRFGGSGDHFCVDGQRYAWADALWLNAAVGNVLEMDDVHRTSTLHPGPVVIPAALAVAQEIKASPRQLLQAIVIGYEAVIRIGRSLGRGHYRYYHNTSTCGSFGAAAAAASLLQLSPEQWVWALGNAGTRTGGLWQMRHEPTDSKQLHNAEAARTGVMAAMLAAEEFRGPARLLEGAQGLYGATSADAMPEAVTADPEGPWLIFDCSFKPWPACRHTHSAIDGALALDLNSGQVREIESVTVATYAEALTFCDRPLPADRIQAQFSLQHCVAICLLEGRPRLASFEADKLHRPSVAALRGKVRVLEDQDISREYPQQFGARVSVRFNDGSEQVVQIADAWGDPENPLQRQDLMDKCHTLMSAAQVNGGAIDKVCESTLQLLGAASLDGWFASLTDALAGKPERKPERKPEK
ncbi:MmgE/PrpD family protein [uncultured Microbulbifer sp.]|uniref:MmgE/PrpD family protein n=1 Tax=uncultured Microbulbifer sp. TaxID=348147 RepID=UPI002606B6D0|nr:MmgE/PrpD family protein [uncultured Microbulbifer sp.]